MNGECYQVANNKTTTVPNIEFRPHDESGGGFELFELESLYKRSSGLDFDPFAPHRVQFHHLIYITEGSGTHFIDFIRCPCREGSFIFVNKNQIHAFDADNRPRGLMILCTQDFIDSIRISIRLPIFASDFYPESDAPVQTVDNGLKESCEILLTEIRKVSGKEPYDRLVIQLLFASLMVILHRERPLSDETRLSEGERQRSSRFLSLVAANFSSTKDATAYADMMGITYKTLNQLCKRVRQKTPKQLIDAHTILEAKRRLAIENVQVTQLAYDLGFEDVSNFIKYFK